MRLSGPPQSPYPKPDDLFAFRHKYESCNESLGRQHLQSYDVEELCRKVLVLGLDGIARKHLLQINGMNKRGWCFEFALHDSSGESSKWLRSGDFEVNVLHALPRGMVGGLKEIRHVLSRPYHHVELYACRRSVPILAIPELRKHNILGVERGDLSYFDQYGALSRAALKWHYKRANHIWFKEPYMDPMLKRLTSQPLVFIPNPGPAPISPPSHDVRDIDFLWANRLLSERKPEWFGEALAAPQLSGSSAVMMGVRGFGEVRAEVLKVQEMCRALAPPNLRILTWADPLPLMRQARYFVMFGAQIFGNHALLEAMSLGAVPIVTESFGVEELIRDGVNGFIAPLTREGVAATMKRAFTTSDDVLNQMRAAALATIADRFSEDLFLDRLEAAYRQLA